MSFSQWQQRLKAASAEKMTCLFPQSSVSFPILQVTGGSLHQKSTTFALCHLHNYMLVSTHNVTKEVDFPLAVLSLQVCWA